MRHRSRDHEDSGGSTDAPERSRSDMLLLHIAEYTALTTRCTYWITIQAALWTLLVLLLGFIATLYSARPIGLFIWLAVAAVQAIGIGNVALLHEYYSAISYLEHTLRPLVETVVGRKPFWQYEHYINTHRPVDPSGWEAGPLGLAVFAVIAATAKASVDRWLLVDVGGLAVNLVLLWYAALQARKASRFRRAFFTTSNSDIKKQASSAS
jgi:hypothetical protein